MSGNSPDEEKTTPGQPYRAMVTPAATELNKHKEPDDPEAPVSPAGKVIELQMQLAEERERLAEERERNLEQAALIRKLREEQANRADSLAARVQREFEEKQARFSPSRLGQTPYVTSVEMANPFVTIPPRPNLVEPSVTTPPRPTLVELEMTHEEDSATIKGFLKAIPVFDYQKALTEPVVFLSFATALNDYFAIRNWTMLTMNSAVLCCAGER
jgi:hypothetical protein